MTPEEPQRHMTIKDLVRLSGYSLGTVSRVLNNQPNVSERARSTILAIAAEHGFELNTSAQSLKQQKSNAVLVVVKGRNNEMFATMVEQLQTLFAATTHRSSSISSMRTTMRCCVRRISSASGSPAD